MSEDFQEPWVGSPAPTITQYVKDSKKKFPVRCPECAVLMLASSLGSHRASLHNVVGVVHSLELLKRLAVDEEYKPTNGRRPGSKPRKFNKKIGKLPAALPALPKPPKPLSVIPMDVEQFVMSVLDTLYPRGVPTKDIPSIGRWTAATERFLTEVSQ